jgi:hypothetical protein
MKLSSNGKILVILLIVVVVCDIFLTPLGGLETRSISNTTSVGFATLAILFVGLALTVASLFLLFRKARLASILAIIGSLCFFPALVADQTGLFSSQHAPVAIVDLELVTAVILIAVLFLASKVYRENVTHPANM